MHVLLNSIHPFTLCVLAQRYPIPRQCGNIVDVGEKSDDWCIDCWMREHVGRDEGKGKRVWNDRWRGGKMWPGYGGERGTDAWRDDMPQ